MHHKLNHVDLKVATTAAIRFIRTNEDEKNVRLVAKDREREKEYLCGANEIKISTTINKQKAKIKCNRIFIFVLNLNGMAWHGIRV